MEETVIATNAWIMRKAASTPVWLSIPIVALLTACSSNEDAASASLEQPREFNAEDKRAARALSISNNRAVTNADSPYARALLCRNGIEALGEQVLKTRGLNEEQREGMAQARAYFDERVHTLGRREGRSKSDISSDLEKIALEHPDAAENAQIASACLMRLLEAN